MPTQARFFTIDEVVNALKQFETSKLVQFAGSSMKEQVSTVHGYTTAVKAEKRPKFSDATDSPFLTKVKDALALYCVVPAGAGAAGSGTGARGKVAITEIIAAIKVEVDAGRAAPKAHMRKLLCFAWLLTEEQAAFRDQAINKKWQGLAVEHTEIGIKKKGPKATKAEAASKMVDNLFE